MSHRNYVFTLHFESLEHAQALLLRELPEHVGYMAYQIEEGSQTGAIHWQGYLELDKQMRLLACKSLFIAIDDHFKKMKLDIRKGTAQQAIDYATKEDTRVDGPFELGTRARQGKKRTSPLDEATDYVVANPNVSMRELDTMFPRATVRYHRQLMELKQRLQQELKDDSDFSPYPWQSRVLSSLSQEADDRHIIWVTDVLGGKGKTRLTNHLVHMHGAVVLSGKLADMTYAYKNKMASIAVFDVTRSAAEHSDHLYTMAEQLKNGVLCNSKYESCMFTFKPPHVIFFANFSWDRSKWSHDRVIEIDLSVPEPPQPLFPDLPNFDDAVIEDYFRFA